MGRTHSTNGEKKKAYGILVGKSEGKRSLVSEPLVTLCEYLVFNLLQTSGYYIYRLF
jgi:hypothetical protein